MISKVPFRWKTTTWGTLATLVYGKALRSYQESDVLYPVYGTNGQIGWHCEYLCPNDGVIVGRKGAYRGIHYSKIPFFVIDTAFYLSPIVEGSYSTKWAYYQLLNFDINKMDSGSAIPSTSRDAFYAIEFPLPPLPIQRKIAAILSAYDDLIENNLRRIKILEEMAQNLYREWFVKFRFPGYENVKFVDSALGKIPEGWEYTNLGEQLVALESGKRPKGGIRDVKDGVPSIGAENIDGIGRHDFNNEKYVPREFFQKINKGVVRDRDVAIYKDGAYIGKSSYFRDGFPHSECCVNEHVFLLRTSGIKLKQNALYLWLQEADTVHAIRATNANAAQPGINQTGVNDLSIITPTIEIAECFDKIAEQYLCLIISLVKRNQNLRRTRDLLLPKLISGEVDVSEMDIKVPEEADA
ncbi:MAG: restriction endonuclease subunit S [Spirochaetales bacterium]|nr:restriction endonuclease subunit S [Spirochaetales bacterium]